MLTKRQQEIVIKTTQSLQPVRLAYNAYYSEGREIHLLYEWGKKVSLADTCDMMISLEEKLSRPIQDGSF
ncbi:MAG: hypothetical protein OXE77_03770 [Flavobacteriaceae bacterium]|nr:hypothetical protein [Flavobacteriaceae bacterium]